MTYRPHMLPKVRSAKIMAHASGQPCTLRIASFFGVRCSGSNTTVGAHLPTAGKGIATKSTDMAVVFACDECHRLLDSQQAAMHYPVATLDRMIAALIETHAILITEGVIVIPDAEFV